jgi:hypothetical protein
MPFPLPLWTHQIRDDTFWVVSQVPRNAQRESVTTSVRGKGHSAAASSAKLRDVRFYAFHVRFTPNTGRNWRTPLTAAFSQ